METRDIFENLSPLDHRYWIANREIFDTLSSILSEKAQVRWCARVEAALLDDPPGAPRPRRPGALRFYRGHRRVHRPRRGLRRGGEDAGTTSAPSSTSFSAKLPPTSRASSISARRASDILDTAKSLALQGGRRARSSCPSSPASELELCRLAIDEAETPQVGRTHGQHAVPLTFGFAMAEYASRLGKCVLRARELAGDLRGKLAGAVGSYNALSMSYPDPEAVERRFLAPPRPGAVASTRPSSSSPSTSCASSSSSTPPSASSPTSPTTCATSSAPRSARCGSPSPRARSAPRRCPRSATPGTAST